VYSHKHAFHLLRLPALTALEILAPARRDVRTPESRTV
jgi:hypothetical protein